MNFEKYSHVLFIDISLPSHEKEEINPSSKLKAERIKAFQSAISKRDEKIATLVKVSVNTMSVSKASVFED